MKKFILNLIIFIFISNCGYSPLYSVKNRNTNFKIGKINITGDRDLNQNIVDQLKNVKSNNKNNNIIYNLTIDTGIEIIVTSKDSKGNPKTYKMISTINLATIKDGKKYDIMLESVENYNDISSKFELENFESNLKKNSASKIIQEIILYLFTL
jgi:hypothetical protein